MDDRQRQIREGAGLAESRLNEEFIEFLQKWSMPLLVTIAVVAVGYAVYGKMEKARNEKVDLAFQELDAAASTANPNPESLLRIGEEYSDVRAVPLVARLAAADSFLHTVRTGLKPGAQLKPDATPASPEDLLSEKDRDFDLTRARELYQQVYDEASRKEVNKVFAITALYGLAAVAECRKELDGAKVHYEKIIAMCDNTPFAMHSSIARSRMESLPQLEKDVKLYHISELAPLAPLPVDNPPPTREEATQGGPPTLTPPVAAPGSTPEAPKTDAPVAPPAAPNADAPKPADTKPAEAPKTPDPKTPEPASPGKPGEPK